MLSSKILMLARTVQAGSSETVEQVYKRLYGSSSEAKAIRRLLKRFKNDRPDQVPIEEWRDDLELAKQAFQSFLYSADVKERVWPYVDPVALKSLSKNLSKISDISPRDAYYSIDWVYNELRRPMMTAMGESPKRLPAESRKWVQEWVNQDGGARYAPSKDTIRDLMPYRPDRTLLLYRGIQFRNVGEMVAFTEEYSTGKKFPFESSRPTSWSTKKAVAERFGRYHASSSHNDAMMGWLSRARNDKDYDGSGGFLISARVQPDDTLVEVAQVPNVSSIHGSEGEVIVLPDVRLTARVVDMYGDVKQEVETFLHGKHSGRKTPQDPYFFHGYYYDIDDIQGDETSGVIKMRKGWGYPAEGDRNLGEVPDSPRAEDEIAQRGVSRGVLHSISDALRANLYRGRWLDDWRVRYESMA